MGCSPGRRFPRLTDRIVGLALQTFAGSIGEAALDPSQSSSGLAAVRRWGPWWSLPEGDLFCLAAYRGGVSAQRCRRHYILEEVRSFSLLHVSGWLSLRLVGGGVAFLALTVTISGFPI